MTNNLSNIPASLLISLISLISVLVSSAPAGEIIRQCDFEAPTYSPGNLAGQGPWAVLAGTPTIESGAGLGGSQSLAAQSALFELPAATAAEVVWLDFHFSGAGSSAQPMLPEDPRTAVLFFSSTRGLLALDGDGEGNGTFTEILPSLSAASYTRITLRLDYANARYDVWTDGALRRSGLGFKDRGASPLAAVRFQADTSQHIDQLALTTWAPDADADADTLSDLDETNLYGTNPTDPDTDADGRSDGAEITAGTDPLDPASFFSASIAPSPATPDSFRISFQTAAGRQYTVQQNPTLDPTSWTNLPGFENLTGPDGQTLDLDLPDPGTSRLFYRIVITK